MDEVKNQEELKPKAGEYGASNIHTGRLEAVRKRPECTLEVQIQGFAPPRLGSDGQLNRRTPGGILYGDRNDHSPGQFHLRERRWRGIPTDMHKS